jgi:hypothetical protein
MKSMSASQLYHHLSRRRAVLPWGVVVLNQDLVDERDRDARRQFQLCG